MSQELKEFFEKITADKALQERLFVTNDLVDVAAIAHEMGFKITGADILRAQAGRVLSLPPDELEHVASGMKAKTGAQWGRGGRGYLDSAGFWLIEFIRWGGNKPADEKQVEAFLLRIKEDAAVRAELISAKSCNDVADIAKKYGYNVTGSQLLRHQAAQILLLNDERAEKVAGGK